MTSARLRTRLKWLQETIPTAKRRRTPRGVLRTCRELGEHRDNVARLRDYACTPADQQAINELIAEIEARRDELAGNGTLMQQVRKGRIERSASANILAGVLRQLYENSEDAKG